MKTGRSLTALAAEIERQANAKKDYVVSTKDVWMVEAEQGGVALDFAGQFQTSVSGLTHSQIRDERDYRIAAAYYNRCLEEKEYRLLATNVNRWFAKYPKPRMFRTLDNRTRAFVSDRYRPLENYDLAEAVLPILGDQGLDIMSCEITETKLYIKAIDPRIHRDVPTGRKMGDGTHTIFDTHSPAVIISNSEVGCGALSIDCGVYTKACTNLAMWADKGMKKYHTGARHELANNVMHLLSDQTRRMTDAAIWMQVRDVVRNAFNEVAFQAQMKELEGLTEQRIEGDPIKTVEMAAKHFRLTEGEKTGVLRHLIEGGTLNRYGLMSAITRTAQDVEDYDRATELEKIGGRVVELPKSEWRQLAEAA